MRYGVYCLCVVFALMYSCAGTSSGDARNPVVSVGGSTVPTITWMPNGAQALHVYRGTMPGGDYDLVWSISTQLTNSLQSPVTYGDLPPGTSSDVGPLPLLRGTPYTIVVERVERITTPAGRDSLRVFQGSTTFIP